MANRYWVPKGEIVIKKSVFLTNVDFEKSLIEPLHFSQKFDVSARLELTVKLKAIFDEAAKLLPNCVSFFVKTVSSITHKHQAHQLTF